MIKRLTQRFGETLHCFVVAVLFAAVRRRRFKSGKLFRVRVGFLLGFSFRRIGRDGSFAAAYQGKGQSQYEETGPFVLKHASRTVRKRFNSS